MSSTQQASGIDVSHYQGSVDWKAVKAGGVSFAFAKATEGTSSVDSMFETNWQGIKGAGVLRGAYHFFRASQDASAQANNFVQTVGQLTAGDLPPVLDVETTDGATDSAIVQGVNTWLNAVGQKMGRAPMIYTTASFWNAHLTGNYGGYPLWVAHYDVAQPNIPSAWSDWAFWQHSQSGAVEGVSGSVDLDYFNGTYADLLAYLKLPSTVVATAAPVQSTAEYTYTVQPGDSLGRIAVRYGTTVSALMEANNITDPNLIEAGQTLTIP
jgi:lysozyme